MQICKSQVETDEENRLCLWKMLCFVRRITQSCSVHLFSVLFEIYFYSAMKKRTQVEQIDDRQPQLAKLCS